MPDAFDLVNTDQTMPALSALDMAKAMLELRPDLPILLRSGYSIQPSLEKVINTGVGFSHKTALTASGKHLEQIDIG